MLEMLFSLIRFDLPYFYLVKQSQSSLRLPYSVRGLHSSFLFFLRGTGHLETAKLESERPFLSSDSNLDNARDGWTTDGRTTTRRR